MRKRLTFRDHPSLSGMIDIVRLKRALRPLKRSRAYVTGIIVDDATEPSQIFNAAAALLLKGDADTMFFKSEVRFNTFTKSACDWRDCEIGTSVTLFIAQREHMPEQLLAACDYICELQPTTPRDVQVAARHFQDVLISDRDAEILIRHKGDINRFISKGRPVSRSLAMIRKLPEPADIDVDHEQKVELVASSKEGPRLEQLTGYGEALDWGIDLAKDLKAYRDGHLPWSQVSKGLLLSGPPGCGKTTYAKALARSCGVPLIAGSYSEWAAGHGQTDLLKKMRKSFEAAAKAAPCVLFIDEIDSFMDRDSMPDYMAAWERQVVNGLLELVDGIATADGIVVIGACNNPGVVDKALKRAGRLDHHIEIPLPDAEAREGIIRHHAGRAEYHFGPGELKEIADRTHGESGASLEKLVRDAIRRARRLDRGMTIADLLDSLPERILLADDYLQRAAVHEVGHALVGIITGKEKLLGIAIADSFSPSDRQTGGIGGGVQFESSFGKIRTKSFYLGQIATMLAAGAAEEMIYGDSADGRIHDLMVATDYATRIEVCLGYGPTLMAEGDLDHQSLQALRFRDRDLQERIDRTLRDQMQLARAILEEHRDLVVSLADQLVIEKSLNPEFIYRALKQRRMRVAS